MSLIILKNKLTRLVARELSVTAPLNNLALDKLGNPLS